MEQMNEPPSDRHPLIGIWQRLIRSISIYLKPLSPRVSETRRRGLVPLEYTIKPYFTLLAWTLSLSLLGRGWTHFTSEPPYWSLLWSEELIQPILTLFGYSWRSYAQNSSIEISLVHLCDVLGWSFLVLGVSSLCLPLLMKRVIHVKSSPQNASLANMSTELSPEVTSRRLTSPPRLISWTRLSLVSVLALQTLFVVSLWWGHLLQFAIWLEQAVTLALPWAVALSLPYSQCEDRHAENLLKYTLSLTFIGHGLYAVGIYPVPSDFSTMVMVAFGLSEESALNALLLIGVMDFIVAITLWIPTSWLPNTRTQNIKYWALIYMLIWGGCTTIARFWGHWESAPIEEWLMRWSPEVLLRLPHALIPLWLIKSKHLYPTST